MRSLLVGLTSTLLAAAATTWRGQKSSWLGYTFLDTTIVGRLGSCSLLLTQPPCSSLAVLHITLRGHGTRALSAATLHRCGQGMERCRCDQIVCIVKMTESRGASVLALPAIAQFIIVHGGRMSPIMVVEADGLALTAVRIIKRLAALDQRIRCYRTRAEFEAACSTSSKEHHRHALSVARLASRRHESGGSLSLQWRGQCSEQFLALSQKLRGSLARLRGGAWANSARPIMASLSPPDSAHDGATLPSTPVRSSQPLHRRRLGSLGLASVGLWHLGNSLRPTRTHAAIPSISEYGAVQYKKPKTAAPPPSDAMAGEPLAPAEGLALLNSGLARAARLLDAGNLEAVRAELHEPAFTRFLGYSPGVRGNAANLKPSADLATAGVSTAALEELLLALKRLDDFCLSNRVLVFNAEDVEQVKRLMTASGTDGGVGGKVDLEEGRALLAEVREQVEVVLSDLGRSERAVESFTERNRP